MPEIKISYNTMDIIDELSEMLGIPGQSYPVRLKSILTRFQKSLPLVRHVVKLLLEVLDKQDFSSIENMDKAKQKALILYRQLS